MRLQDAGCICCAKEGFKDVPVDVHHLVDNGYRKHSGGDKATLPLCPWHHRGVPPGGLSAAEAEKRAGPSMARNKKRFIQRYGTERELLAETNQRIEELERIA
jgi:hypothetical protein